MCDFYLITVKDLDNNVVADDQFGPDSDNHVPENEVCTCGIWKTTTGDVLVALVAKYLREMPYGTLIIEKLP